MSRRGWTEMVPFLLAYLLHVMVLVLQVDTCSLHPGASAARADSSVCTTDQCHADSKWLRAFLDENKDPCSDFASFTCSPVKKMEYKHNCDACSATDGNCKQHCGSSTWSLMKATNASLSGILKATGSIQWLHDGVNNYMGEGLAKLTGRVGQAYNDCKNHASRGCSKLGTSQASSSTCTDPLIRYIEDIPDDHKIEEVIAGASRIRDMGFHDKFEAINPFFYLYVEYDYEVPTEGMKLHFHPKLCGDDIEQVKSELMPKARIFADAISKSRRPPQTGLGGGNASQALDMYSEIFLSGMIPTDECKGLHDDYDDGMFLHDLQKEADNAAWDHRLGLDLEEVLHALGISGNPKVIVQFSDERNHVEDWAKKVRSTFMGYDGTKLRQAFAGLRIINFVREMSEHPMPEQCEKMILDLFPMFFSARYSRDVLKPSDRNDAEEIAWEVLEALEGSFTDLKWMDKDTARAAEIKARHLRLNIGWPRWILDDAMLLSYYNYALSVKDSWWELMLASRSRNLKRALQHVEIPRNWEIDWVMAPTSLEPERKLYENLANSLFFPAALLEKPDFDNNASKAFIFASLGFKYAQQLIHGFDAIGQTHGPYGDSSSWFSSDSLHTYTEQAYALIEKMVKVTVFGDRLDGSPDSASSVTVRGHGETDYESIADVGAVRVAHMAYMNWVRKHGDESRLPGLEKYTPSQLFFMRFGASLCDFNTTASLNAYTGSFAPNRLRVNLAVQNSQAFAAAFSCPKGAPMAPVERCELWGKEADAEPEPVPTPSPTSTPTPTPEPQRSNGIGGATLFLMIVLCLVLGGGAGFFGAHSQLGEDLWCRMSARVQRGNTVELSRVA